MNRANMDKLSLLIWLFDIYVRIVELIRQTSLRSMAREIWWVYPSKYAVKRELSLITHRCVEIAGRYWVIESWILGVNGG